MEHALMMWKNHALTDEQDVLLRTGSPDAILHRTSVKLGTLSQA
jgi:hypothetical protein